MANVDLHTHSNYSDGTDSVSEIINLCIKNNVETLSLTDHDNIVGLYEAKALSEKNNIRFITGVELSATFFDEEIHILCYNFDLTSKKLNDFLENAKDFRILRNKKLFRNLNDIGIKINENDFDHNDDVVITRGDIADLIFKRGYAKSSNEAFFAYLARGKVAYIKKEAYSYDQILTLINDIGALSSLAHPNSYSFYNTNLKSSLKKLKKSGLHAVECFHSSYNQSISNNLLGITNRLNLLKTGGSDYHGTKKDNVYFGKATDNKYIDTALISDFLSSIN